jgi:methylaspartate mutase epsilon subunit
MTATLDRAPPFGAFIASARRAGALVVQPRMGMSDPRRMRAGLLATKRVEGTTVGTITLDSYTRLGAHHTARRALREGVDLNGYPLVAHGVTTTSELLRGVRDAAFPVQVRHGSPDPRTIVRCMIRAGLDVTEGGPVSYCLPYGRTPLRECVQHWTRCAELLAELRPDGAQPHLETFGGCMMGQLCPPSLLVAIGTLEAVFFRKRGIASISVSYAQQTSPAQDREAVLALRRMLAEHLAGVDWHVVVYTYMGVYPRTRAGAGRLAEEAVRLAVHAGAARLIVKTAAEAYRIPTIAENVEALEHAAAAAVRAAAEEPPDPVVDTGVEAEARELVGAVLDLHDDVGRALLIAFRRGYLDVPYCLHPDNAGRSRAALTAEGRLTWTRTGSMPLGRRARPPGRAHLTAAELLSCLTYLQRTYDQAAALPRS